MTDLSLAERLVRITAWTIPVAILGALFGALPVTTTGPAVGATTTSIAFLVADRAYARHATGRWLGTIADLQDGETA